MAKRAFGFSRRLNRRDFLQKVIVGGGAVGSVLAGVRGGPTLAQGAASAPKGPTALEFWQIAQGPSFQGVMGQAIKDFQEKFPNIKVSLNEQPTLNLRTKLQAVFTSGGPGPDVVFEGVPPTLSYAALP